MRAVAGFGDHREIVAAPQTPHERRVLDEARPRRDRHDAPDIRIAFEHLAGSFGEQHVDRGALVAAGERANERRREQHVAEIAQRDDEDRFRRRHVGADRLPLASRAGAR